jgi:hypothetical protein
MGTSSRTRRWVSIMLFLGLVALLVVLGLLLDGLVGTLSFVLLVLLVLAVAFGIGPSMSSVWDGPYKDSSLQ